MSQQSFGTLPNKPTIPINPFKVEIAQEKIDNLNQLLKATEPPTKTYENLTTGKDGNEDLGVSHEWLSNALKVWKDDFSWRKTEEVINSFPQFKGEIQYMDQKFDVHFMGLFSLKKDAIPIVFSHGWPGSFLEFIPLCQYLTKTYTPETLPVHVVVPSLIGFGFSSPPSLDRDFTMRDTATLFDKLMLGLGFGDGYLAQGGDIGYLVSMIIGGDAESCKAVHVNMCNAPIPEGYDKSKLDKFERKAIERTEFFNKWEFAYKNEHATKTATIATVVSSSPLALLAWIGEKSLVWSDPSTTPPLNSILSNISLYFLTNTFPTSLYHYRISAGKNMSKYKAQGHLGPDYLSKPTGYSQFAYDLNIIPIDIAKGRLNVVWSKQHERGGHFAAWEVAEDLWADVKEFLELMKKEKVL